MKERTWSGGWARFSDDGVYRYVLERTWDRNAPGLIVVLLNPSTADAEHDDPTIRRVVGFAKRDGFGSVVVTNLFALRSTDPRALRSHPDPIGPENDDELIYQAECADQVWLAWGSDPMARERGASVRRQLGTLPVYCLGTNRDGQPKHPLYLRGDTPAAVAP